MEWVSTPSPGLRSIFPKSAFRFGDVLDRIAARTRGANKEEEDEEEDDDFAGEGPSFFC